MVEGLAPPTRAVVHSHDTICRRLRIHFTVTFDQFNASLINKSLNSFKKEFLYWYSQMF